MALNAAQETTLVNFLKASVDAGVVLALSQRNDVFLADWLNAANSPAVPAWNSSMTARDLFEAIDLTKFDALTAGKRDAHKLLLDYAPFDFSRQKMRKALVDIWGNTDSVAVLQNCQRNATRAEVAITPNDPGNQATTNTVTGLRLNWVGPVSITEVSIALNKNA